jgi:protein phosphatase 1G
MGPAQTRTIDHDTQYEVGEKIRYCHSTITGWREDNEDAHVAVLDMNDGTGNSLFGVFDGHGGKLSLSRIS